MRVYKLNEARNKERFFYGHDGLTDEQKEELIKLYKAQYVPDNIVDWQHIKDYSFDDLKAIVDKVIQDREAKKNKKNLSRAIEGRDYIKVFENTNEEGTEYLYLPLTWIGSKYLASDHFLPKIKVPSKVMQARDFSDNSAENEDLSPGAKWCISLWTLPDWVKDDEPFKDLEGKEFRHEGKKYWLSYTSGGAYFLFYFRDYNNLDDINKKIAFTLRQGSSKIEDITLADDTRGTRDSDIERVQKYWDKHYKEYESHIEHMREVSIKERPKFKEYEIQKEKEAKKYYNSHRKGYTLKEYFTYNESTGRYDSLYNIDYGVLRYLRKDGEFKVPLGVISGDFDCGSLDLNTLKNGPTEVEGDFYCQYNNLTTLEGAPQKVGLSFDCNNNKLTTLKGSPKKVGGSFSCYKNKLTTLEYAPQEIGGGFNCSENNLTTLEDAPKIVGRSFYCHKNQLTSLKGAPKKIEGIFNCAGNKLTSLEYAPEYVERYFDCIHNKLKTLEGAPKYVGGCFYCEDNPLQSRELSTEVRGTVFYD